MVFFVYIKKSYSTLWAENNKWPGHLVAFVSSLHRLYQHGFERNITPCKKETSIITDRSVAPETWKPHMEKKLNSTTYNLLSKCIKILFKIDKGISVF